MDKGIHQKWINKDEAELQTIKKGIAGAASGQEYQKCMKEQC